LPARGRQQCCQSNHIHPLNSHGQGDSYAHMVKDRLTTRPHNNGVSIRRCAADDSSG
jgi:hypothetical protein